MGDELPFRAEYAKSGRAGCKLCKNNIGKDELRLAVMVQSPKFDGKVPNWFHLKCFFTRNKKVKTVADIADFNSLRWEDQKKIKDTIGGNENNEPAKSKSKKASAASDLNDFSVEYAKSSRSTCKSCLEKIDKGVVRISKQDYDSDNARRYGPLPLWHHMDCFIKDREELEYFDSAEQLSGFFTLGVDDQKVLKAKLKKIASKRKQENTSEVEPKKQKIANKEEEKKLKTQSDLIFKYRDWLQTNLNKTELSELLEANGQSIPKGESRILDLLADCMTFGALEQCTECTDGQLRFKTDGYHCAGNLSGWTTCQFSTKTPKRKPFVIPKEFKEEHAFLKKYKRVVGERLLPSNPELPSQPSSSNSDAIKKKETSTVLPLENLKIAIAGKLSKSPKEFAKVIEGLGGSVVSSIDENVACVISNEEELQKNGKKIKNAKKSNVHVVSEKFLDDVKNGGAALMISQHNLCSWGGDPTFKISAFMASKSKPPKLSGDGKLFTKSVPDKIKMTVKGSAAVEPESELVDVAHVLEEKGSVYSAVLNMVDIVKGTNSYYRLQVLEHDKMHSYWVFRSWGRVGTIIGGTKCDPREDKQDAISEFIRLYEEKTGNRWEDRKNFVKHPNRFYPVDIDYGQDSKPEQKLKPGSKSKLQKEVQELICLIFDIESMKKAMIQFELDLKKMPLGKLTKQQIQHAYSVLTEAQNLIQKGESESKIVDASNRFYTLIPHDFGMRKAPPLNNEDIIKNKMEMLESLLEIEIAYSLLKETKADEDVDPVDQHYHQLKTDIVTLEESSEEYDNIHKYLNNTHAETHRQYELKLEKVFKISRQGEAKKFKPFKQLHNRLLLWHGSRLTNFAGILSQGLRIAPPEAPTTGYMFGKGIYFADMVSKSANYCYPGVSNPVGLLLLCEVALGNMYERKNADYITKLPPNMHSTKGVGGTMPDPEQSVTLPEGTVIPLGKPVSNKVKGSSLLYNEYIIYDTAQVNIKYLLQVKFNWNY